MRLAKFIARAGIVSRRQGEAMIFAGEVSVNGLVVSEPGQRVSDSDIVVVQGRLVPFARAERVASRPRLWLFHKPRKVIVSRVDQQGRQVLFDLLPRYMPRVVTVGRLDYDTDGLIMLTDSGYLARFFELPANQVLRVYQCKYRGELSERQIAAAQHGLLVDGLYYREIGIERTAAPDVIRISLSEGKNREIRKMMEAFGLQVIKLARVQYDRFALSRVSAPGSIVEVGFTEIKEAVSRINLSS